MVEMAILMKAMEPLAVDDTDRNICNSLQIAASSRVSAAKPQATPSSMTNDDDSLDMQQIMTTYEPLKVCLDDDSSIEDGDDDDDMFDDDAFTFGDEDFQALMAHNMKKVTASITSHESGRISAPSTTTASLSTSNASHIPLHKGSSTDSDRVVESLPSTAASSQVS